MFLSEGLGSEVGDPLRAHGFSNSEREGVVLKPIGMQTVHWMNNPACGGILIRTPLLWGYHGEEGEPVLG